MEMIRRGQIWWIDLEEPLGSKPGYRRPVLVLQRDEVNTSRINTVVVSILTTHTALAQAPGNTLLPRKATGLRKDSVVNASQILTVNKTDLDEKVAAIPKPLMQAVDEGLRWFLHLDAD